MPATPPDAAVRIALLADPHCKVSGDGGIYLARFQEAIRQVNAAGVDAVLVAGDTADTAAPEEWELFRRTLTELAAPSFYVPGNHDLGAKPNTGQDDTTTSALIAAYEKAMRPSFWVHSLPGLRILGINASLLGTGLPEELAQWEFLERTLGETSAVRTVLLSHYPLFVDEIDEPGGTYWNVEPEPRRRLLEVIRSAGVSAVLSGHLHRPLLHHLDGLLFVGAPPVSFGLPPGVQPEGWTLLTVPAAGEIQVEIRQMVSAA